MRSLLLLFTVSLTLAGCHSPDYNEPGSDCCAQAKALVASAPACCQVNLGKPPAEWTGCCTEGMVADADPASRPDCCKQTLAMRADLPACCSDALFEGKISDCCADMLASK